MEREETKRFPIWKQHPKKCRCLWKATGAWRDTRPIHIIKLIFKQCLRNGGRSIFDRRLIEDYRLFIPIKKVEKEEENNNEDDGNNNDNDEITTTTTTNMNNNNNNNKTLFLEIMYKEDLLEILNQLRYINKNMKLDKANNKTPFL